MSSWGRSACYPQSTFYPLSDGPSMRYHRITMSHFRAWSRCLSRSQAPLCHCTLPTIADRREGTLESLRYSFGGDHPSQTTHQTMSGFTPVRPSNRRGRYFNNDSKTPSDAPSQSPAYPTHSITQRPTLSCSKGSWGLFVPLRVSGIFTATSISPSSWPRQRPDRCTIRAGRNLPDKEFRYLRTVIVTAAVYWGFNSALRLANAPS